VGMRQSELIRDRAIELRIFGDISTLELEEFERLVFNSPEKSQELVEFAIFNDTARAVFLEDDSEDLSEVVSELVRILGKKLTALIGGAKDASVVDEWIARNRAATRVEPRLRLALRVARSLEEHDHESVVEAWFKGLNPKLGQAPLLLIRDGNLDEVEPKILDAMRAFIAGG
jgi:hypothetical protein